MQQIIFADKMVSYETFINDVAARVASLVKEDRAYPDYISQRKAYRLFGRGNVDRWRNAGKLTTCKRPGKVEYRTSELRMLQRTE
jgi:hypothetical protein